MTTKRKPTRSEVQTFITSMKAMKAAERTNGVRIYSDALLRVCVVVELGGQWWLVPRSRDGWQRRQRLTLTPEVRLDRLTPAKHIDAAWLGVPVDTPPPELGSFSEQCAQVPTPTEHERHILHPGE